MALFSQATLNSMSRRKVINSSNNGSAATVIPRKLGAFDLILYGVGSSVGAGIYVLVGLGAHVAGPAISLSFFLCGLACILTSLSYADFAARIPITGSAFTYAYVAFGEFWAWIVGWNLILGFGFTTSVVARAWGDYVGGFTRMGNSDSNVVATTIRSLAELPLFGPDVDYTCSPLSAMLIAVNTCILLRGVEDSSKFTNVMTILNISVLVLVVVTGWATGSVHPQDNLEPFMPHGFGSVLQGAGLVFFAFIGFDMVASLSEEVVNPGWNMPIGIVGSLLVSSTIYIAVTVTVIGMAPIGLLGNQVPVVNALMANACCTHDEQLLENARQVCIYGQCGSDLINNSHYMPILALVARLVSGGAILGLMASSFTSLMGQPRIFYRMALDGLWFPLFARLDPVTNVPRQGTIVTGFAAAFLACFAPLDALASLISLGTLMVFTFVNGGVILLRLRNIQDAIISRTSTTSTSVDKHADRSKHAVVETKVGIALVVYTVAVIIASMVYTAVSSSSTSSSNSSSFLYTLLAFISLTVMILSAIYIILYVPHNYKLEHDSAVDHFECPLVPFLPLAGIACNCFMMGSLPLTSWILCSIWLLAGVAVYFSYGIHHSVLGAASAANNNNNIELNEENGMNDVTPLLDTKSGNGKATYDSAI